VAAADGDLDLRHQRASSTRGMSSASTASSSPWLACAGLRDRRCAREPRRVPPRGGAPDSLSRRTDARPGAGRCDALLLELRREGRAPRPRRAGGERLGPGGDALEGGDDAARRLQKVPEVPVHATCPCVLVPSAAPAGLGAPGAGEPRPTAARRNRAGPLAQNGLAACLILAVRCYAGRDPKGGTTDGHREPAPGPFRALAAGRRDPHADARRRWRPRIPGHSGMPMGMADVARSCSTVT
jgi:hypothetical protein